MTDKIEIVNLTPHEITIYMSNGQVLRIPPSGVIARVSVSAKIIGEVNNIPIRAIEYGEVQNLPEPKPGVVYIVSIIVLMALKSKGIVRNDVFAPDTSPDSAVRDEKGNVVGVKYLQAP